MMTMGSFNVVRGYGLFGGFVPTGVVMKEGSGRGLYFFKSFMEDSQEPLRGA